MHWCFPYKYHLCEGPRSSGTGVTDSCELPCRCWELNQTFKKKGQCSQSLSHLSSPQNQILKSMIMVLVLVCVCHVYQPRCTHGTVGAWRSADNYQELVLSFYTQFYTQFWVLNLKGRGQKRNSSISILLSREFTR